MFINLIQFPPVKTGKDGEFRKWFEWSNTIYSKFDGFISRKLLKPSQGNGGYAALVEHKSEQTFMVMHTSAERQQVWAKVEPLITGAPTPQFYTVLISSS